MGKLINQILGLGYHIVEGVPLRSVPVGDDSVEIRQLQARTQSGQTIAIRPDNKPILFPVSSAYEQGVHDHMLAGDAKTTNSEIYQDYYGLDENAMSWLLHNYSLRTKAYLSGEKERIGLIDYKYGLPEAFFALDKYTIGRGIGEVDVGQYADGRFVVQKVPLFDEAQVLRMHFTRFPSKQDVEDAAVIRKLEHDFKFGRHREMFFCGKCGQAKHWLDIDGPLEAKLSMRLKRLCGCNGSEG